MAKATTDTCECGRPEVGPQHCPVHGDGKRQPAEQSAQEPPDNKPRRVTRRKPVR